MLYLDFLSEQMLHRLFIEYKLKHDFGLKAYLIPGL